MRNRRPVRRAVIAVLVIAGLLAAVAGASAASLQPTPAQCAKDKGAVCGYVAPAGGNTILLTVAVGQGVNPDTYFDFWTGVAPTNIRPAGVCSSKGTGHLEFPETKIVDATYYVTHCKIKIADGHTARICFDAANFGRYTITPPPGQYEAPFEEPPYIQSSNGAGAPGIVEPAVSGCPLGASSPSGSTACHVPNVKGKSLSVAQRAISAGHCKPGAVRRVKSSRVKKATVISQKPGAGAHPPGTRVSLLVSS